MKVLEPGHVYELGWLDGVTHLPTDNDHGGYPASVRANRLVFVNREGNPHPGTQTQEVIRALIDRTQHCDRCLRWEGNDQIIHHLRMALVLHEARALERKTIKGYIKPETITTGPDGHFDLEERE